MKKNQYICPSIQILGFNYEGMLLSLSKTETETPPGTAPSETPGTDDPTTNPDEVPAKPFDDWNTWNWDE